MRTSKKILSLLVVCMVMLMIPVFSSVVNGASTGKTIYVSENGKDSGKGSLNAPYKTFDKALKAAKDGDTIQISGTVWVDRPSNGSDDPLIISKKVTVQGQGDRAELYVGTGGIILGTDVTFNNLQMNFANLVRNAIIANGYTLTLNNVTSSSSTTNIHVFAGGLTSSIAYIPIPQIGNSGKIIISGKNKLGNVFAGSLSDVSSLEEAKKDSNNYTGNATIVIEQGTSGSIGKIYAHGARESRGEGTGDVLYPSSRQYIVSGKVDIILNQRGFVKAIDGKTRNSDAPKSWASVTYNVSNTSLSDQIQLDNLSELYIKAGKLSPTVGSMADGLYGLTYTEVTVADGAQFVPPPGGIGGSGTPPPVTPPGDNDEGGTPPVQPGAANVVVVNNVKLKDTVTVSNVSKGDIIKVYSDAAKSKVIGKATAKKDNVVITISKGLPTEEHVIYVTKQAKGQDEGEAIRVTFAPEKVTDSPSESNIQVGNNVGNKKDTITVTNVKAKDVVKVYASAADAANAKAKPLGQATVRRAGEVTVKIRKGFDFESYPGEVYVTVQSYNERNSKPVPVKVTATPKAELNKENVTVNNQLGVKADTITVTNVTAKDVIKVYASAVDVGNAKAKPLGTAKVKKDGEVTVKVRKGFKDLTEVYVTRTSVSLDESPFVTVEVGEDAKATPVRIDDVAFTNNVDSADILTVKNLNVKDSINVYKKGSTTAIGKGTTTKLGTVVIKLKEELNVADVVEITRSSRLEAESERVEYTVGNPA